MLISPASLKQRLGEVATLDASWHMPDAGRDPASEFEDAHIPGAQRFDIDAIADHTSGLPHTVPTAEMFAHAVGAMGIGNDTEVVVYEAGPTFAAPRVWWTFAAMGHRSVSMLDGGLALWRAEGFPVERGPAPAPTPRHYTAHFGESWFANADQVAAALRSGATVIDVRSPERFEGRAPEPRPGVRSGHMPGAHNIHYALLVDDSGRFKPSETLETVLQNAGIGPEGEIITSCGSGVTAAIMALALTRLGTKARVYDGSWTEWGGDPQRTVIEGKA